MFARDRLLLLFFWLGGPLFLHAEPWSQQYSGLDRIQGISSIESTPHGSVVIGVRASSGASCIVEISSDGDPLRTRCFENVAPNILPVADGYLMYGSNSSWHRKPGDSHGFTPEDAVALRLDSELNIVWYRRFGSTSGLIILGATAAAGGGFALAGMVQREAASFVIKLSSDGKTEWQRQYNLTDRDTLEAITAVPDGGFAAAGGGRSRPWVLRLDSSGHVMWQAFSGRLGVAHAIAPHPRGGFMVAGAHYEGRRRGAWIALVEEKGSIAWQRYDDDTHALNRIFVSPDGSAVASGGYHWATQLTAFAPTGTVRWQRTIRFSLPALANSLTDGFLVARSNKQNNLEIYSLDAGGRGDSCLAAAMTETKAEFVASTETTNFDLEGSSLLSEAVEAETAVREVALLTSAVTCEDFADVPPAEAKLPTAAEQMAAAVDAEHRDLRDRARAMLNEKRFGELDKWAGALRKSSETISDGYPKLASLYDGLSEIHETQSESDHMALLDEWRAVAPVSPTAAVATAAALIEHGERARGGGYGSGVSESGAERFRRLLDRAGKVLDRAASTASSDPHYWVTRAAIAGWRCDGLGELVRSAQVRRLRYPHFYPSVARFFLPRWCGSPAEFVKFADLASNSTRPESRDAVYAAVAWVPIASEQRGELRKFPFDWQRLKRGFEDHVKRFPGDPRGHHRFAHAAWIYSDRATARALFSGPQLGWGSFAEDIWNVRGDYEAARSWAMSEPVEDFMRQQPSAAASNQPAAGQSSSTPVLRKPGSSSWATAPATQWPPLFLLNRLELRDGAVADRFHSFLVETGDGVVAISTLPASLDKAITEMGGHTHRRPMSLVELRGEMKTWTMTAPSNTKDRLSIASIEDIPKRGESHSVLLTVTTDANALPVRVLKAATRRFETGGRVYIVGCSPPDTPCSQTVYPAEVGSTNLGGSELTFGHININGAFPAEHLAGAPVLNEDGLVVAVLSGYSRGTYLGGPTYVAEEVGSILQKAGIWKP